MRDKRITKIVIIDQSRKSANTLLNIEGVDDVVTYEPDFNHLLAIGHDHAASLDRFINSYNFTTSHLLILDSDCFPIKQNWLDNFDGDDSVLAADPKGRGLSHPCFMALPISRLKFIDFSEGLLELGIDCGRLVALQLLKQGVKVELIYPSRAFNGLRGYFFKESIYHHGSASFSHSTDARLLGEVEKESESFFKEKVVKQEYYLTFREYLYLRTKRVIPRLFSEISLAGRSMVSRSKPPRNIHL